MAPCTGKITRFTVRFSRSGAAPLANRSAGSCGHRVTGCNVNKAWPPSGLDNGADTLRSAVSPISRRDGLRAVSTTDAQTPGCDVQRECRFHAGLLSSGRRYGLLISWTIRVARTGTSRSGMIAGGAATQSGCAEPTRLLARRHRCRTRDGLDIASGLQGATAVLVSARKTYSLLPCTKHGYAAYRNAAPERRDGIVSRGRRGRTRAWFRPAGPTPFRLVRTKQP